ncbi:MAG: endolytic transglycosylase MltG [Candidatus Buchananbacteria bacterium]
MLRLFKKIVIIILLLIVGYGAYFYYTLNVANTSSSDLVKFTIQPKWGSMVISQELKKTGLIRDWMVFEFYVWYRGTSSYLQPGEFDLKKNYTIKEIAQVLTRGAENVILKEVNLTFIEGWNNNDYAQYLAKQGFGQDSDFLNLVQKKQAWWDNFDFLGSRPKDRDLEGYLFPDTYRVYKNATIKDIVSKMLENFGKKLTPKMRNDIIKQNKSIHEILTLASIVEKEVSSEKDRKLVAGIFYKRLKINMGLQSDATLNYITNKGTVQPSIDDTKLDSLYNTYKYRGLPPGPICNPGISAIEAAIYPTVSDYLYFLTTPDGQTIYSKTYEQHLAAKRKYLK